MNIWNNWKCKTHFFFKNCELLAFIIYTLFFFWKKLTLCVSNLKIKVFLEIDWFFLFCNLHHSTKDVICFITNSNKSPFLYLLTLLGAPRALGLRTSKVKGHRYTDKVKKNSFWSSDFLKTETILTIFDYVNYPPSPNNSHISSKFGSFYVFYVQWALLWDKLIPLTEWYQLLTFTLLLDTLENDPIKRTQL